MSPAPTPDRSDEVLRAFLLGGGQDLYLCVKVFTPLLFALAAHYRLAQPEDAVYLALSEIRRCAPCWEASGLPAHLWVAGIARRRFECLGRRPAEEPGPLAAPASNKS
ncbi:hypothetical protein [Deinococcus petrolearius]|uniref:RNA polymerase sigma-70 region 2 domain-containing protein n=1 Tax=Deinococcus petrolearius TaxID=1751295 RepID=A0ABW1DG86_9DEIO